MTNTESTMFNVCVYEGRDRIAKETIEASSARQAATIVRAVLRGNGFTSLKGLRFETIPLD